jgi:peptide/nickel transport system permease protein
MRALRFVVGRLLGLGATLLIASFVIFGALSLAPGTPLTFLTRGRDLSPDDLATLNAQYHLSDPFFERYWYWLTDILHGNLGTSILYKEDVLSLLGARAANTVFLVIYAATLIVLVGLAVGIVAGLRPGWLDRMLMVAATASMAVPAFVAAIVLIAVFAVGVDWFPVFGPGAGLVGRARHLTLPSVALALSSVAYVARLTRVAVRQEMSAEHVQTATSRGLPRSVVIRRHVLQNAMIPIVTVAGLSMASLIAGTVVVEQVFQLNGLGSLLIQAVQQKDFPVVQAICLLFVTAFIVLNTVVDLTYSLLDPRISAARRNP